MVPKAAAAPPIVDRGDAVRAHDEGTRASSVATAIEMAPFMVSAMLDTREVEPSALVQKMRPCPTVDAGRENMSLRSSRLCSRPADEAIAEVPNPAPCRTIAASLAREERRTAAGRERVSHPDNRPHTDAAERYRSDAPFDNGRFACLDGTRWLGDRGIDAAEGGTPVSPAAGPAASGQRRPPEHGEESRRLTR